MFCGDASWPGSVMTGVEYAFWHLCAAVVLDLPAYWLLALMH